MYLISRSCRRAGCWLVMSLSAAFISRQSLQEDRQLPSPHCVCVIVTADTTPHDSWKARPDSCTQLHMTAVHNSVTGKSIKLMIPKARNPVWVFFWGHQFSLVSADRLHRIIIASIIVFNVFWCMLSYILLACLSKCRRGAAVYLTIGKQWNFIIVISPRESGVACPPRCHEYGY